MAFEVGIDTRLLIFGPRHVQATIFFARRLQQ
ncbi:hypothetical protein DFR37_103124 [Eoetvoesiella caeni]|uniref:Uncharacterized protein n=1 Tax=Eoetvoesiella caeni TaxID=645616 RepID=A0A366HFL8_9BURK|nr:hypothetical protein DFR37_103124 [Eoetvoesiella caeni]